ncbi:MAG: 7-carboxy-7-deazaguanine synthase QueE [Candidatus Omnitrophica bacterium]|nr:7-carboxy-7-deazaguanine synthase QueE [Candidatus Omnitrophota bacterium]
MSQPKGKISEIFKSIQGEGLYQGQAQVFVRFFGCNLTCRFCDTKLDSYQEFSIDELMSKIAFFDNYHSVSLTGGEPLVQVEFLRELSQRLKKAGKLVYLETNGTLYQNLKQVIDSIDIVAMDFKLPSSTESKDFWFMHREFLKVAQTKEVFIKAVIGKASRVEDLRIALAVIKEVNKDLLFVLQPENPYEEELKGKLNYFEKVCKERNINLSVVSQLHKILGVK